MSLVDEEPTIMIVDDEPDILELIGFKIKALVSLDVIKADNPCEALEILKTKNIPIVITDINMPEMSGVELLEEIQLLKKGIQVIVLTAGTSTINCLNCFKQGASDFLVKPIDEEDFKKVILNAMDRFYRWKRIIHTRKVGAGLPT